MLVLYDYIPTISQGATYITEKSYYQANLASKDKTWETIETTNIGLDLGLLNGRLNASFDYYWKYNNDMLSNLQLPHTIGIGVPAVNVGKLKTWGWEFEIKWADRIGDFSYQVAFNLSDSQNKLVEYDGADVIYAGTVGLLEGYALNTIWVIPLTATGRARRSTNSIRKLIRVISRSLTERSVVVMCATSRCLTPTAASTIRWVQVTARRKITATWCIWATPTAAISTV